MLRAFIDRTWLRGPYRRAQMLVACPLAKAGKCFIIRPIPCHDYQQPPHINIDFLRLRTFARREKTKRNQRRPSVQTMQRNSPFPCCIGAGLISPLPQSPSLDLSFGAPRRFAAPKSRQHHQPRFSNDTPCLHWFLDLLVSSRRSEELQRCENAKGECGCALPAFASLGNDQ